MEKVCTGLTGRISTMIIICNKFSIWILGGKFNAMCIWPLLFIKPGSGALLKAETLNHERIHARQQLEMLWLFFFLWYGIEYTFRLIQHRDLHAAYMALSHEREAFTNDGNTDYLNKRKGFAWVKYL
jgi:hypothetical protein